MMKIENENENENYLYLCHKPAGARWQITCMKEQDNNCDRCRDNEESHTRSK